MAKHRKTPISPEEIRKIEAAIRREEWVEKGCPFFKTGAAKDKKKERNRTHCRRKVELPWTK
jgi:hypothetical protein